MPDVSSGWGRLTWGQANWNEATTLAQGWGAKTWGAGEWNDLSSETIVLTGLSAQTAVGVLDAQIQPGWGTLSWGINGWGSVEEANETLPALSLTSAVGTLTVADLKAAKGKKKFTQVTANSHEEANAAEKAGFDMIICQAKNVLKVREGSKHLFLTASLILNEYVTKEDIMRGAFKALEEGADAARRHLIRQRGGSVWVLGRCRGRHGRRQRHPSPEQGGHDLSFRGDLPANKCFLKVTSFPSVIVTKFSIYMYIHSHT